MIDIENSLPDLQRKVLDDFSDPDCFYWVYTNYFDIQRDDSPLPTDRTITRWWQAPLFLNHDAIWNAEFVHDGMVCNVILKNQLPAQRERIKIEYQQIYRISCTIAGKSMTEKESNVYSDTSKLKMPS